jgi:hypothetical protein
MLEPAAVGSADKRATGPACGAANATREPAQDRPPTFVAENIDMRPQV